MKPEMSEFSYGFAFTNELIHAPGSHVVAAPEFPSLQKEGSPGGGYDVKIPFGSPLFLQFKLSHSMARTNSKEYGVMGGAYYRWHLHALKHSAQHDLLLDLESRGNEVYYVAPAFHQTAELNTYFQSKKIVEQSSQSAQATLARCQMMTITTSCSAMAWPTDAQMIESRSDFR
jgi:hypothetical protein